MHLAPTNVKGDYTLEIYDQLRPLGRILEHFRAVHGGRHPEKHVHLCLGGNAHHSPLNEASVYNAAGQVVSNNVFMGMLEDLPESGPETVATRYCVVTGADRTLEHSRAVLGGSKPTTGRETTH
jgi:hypothetical protein